MTPDGPRTQFVQVPLWVLDDPRVACGEGGTILRIYVAACAEISFKSRVGKIPVMRLMDRTNLGRAIVYRALATLREIGALRERPNGTIWLPLDNPVDSTTVDTLSTVVESASTTVDGALLTEVDSESTTTPTASEEERAMPDYGFEKWWKAYPLRHGRRVGKNTALQRWRRLSYDTKARVYTATLHYAEACEREETIAMDPYRFIGSTRRWEDWVDPLGSLAPRTTPHPVTSRRELGCEDCEGGMIEDGEGNYRQCPRCHARPDEPQEALG